jgi:MarR family transcriptional regulator, organic hydroperoxide resistance regulator
MNRDLVLFSIGRVNERANRFLEGELKKNGLGDLGVSHAEIIGVLLMQGKVQMKDLVALIGKDKSTITALVKKLARLGLIKKVPDPEDNRVTHILLSEKGRKLEGVIMAISKRLRVRAYRGLSEKDKERLAEVLERIGNNF